MDNERQFTIRFQLSVLTYQFYEVFFNHHRAYFSGNLARHHYFVYFALLGLDKRRHGKRCLSGLGIACFHSVPFGGFGGHRISYQPHFVFYCPPITQMSSKNQQNKADNSKLSVQNPEFCLPNSGSGRQNPKSCLPVSKFCHPNLKSGRQFSEFCHPNLKSCLPDLKSCLPFSGF